MKYSTICSPKNHQGYYESLLQEGLKKHGILKSNDPHHTDSDFIVAWGYKPLQEKWARVIRTGKPILVLERGYIGNREEWTSISWNGLNGRANFCNQSITCLNRWNEHFKKYSHEWKMTNEKSPVLVIGQCYHDASVAHININSWYDKVIQGLQDRGHTVLFRAHPLNKQEYIPSCKIDKNKTLEETLNQVKACVTFNSNSGVISVLNGIPTISADVGSMVYNVSSHNLNNINYKPDLNDWFAKISYCQWSKEEIKKGIFWDTLKYGLK